MTSLSFDKISDRQTTETADQPLVAFVAAELGRQNAEAQRKAHATADDYESFTRTAWDDRFPFVVHISSAWASEGEQSVEVDTFGTVKEAIRAAIAEFKKINRRSDVQGRYAVGIKLENGTYISVPEGYWREHTRFGMTDLNTISRLVEVVGTRLLADPASLNELRKLVESEIDAYDLEPISFDEQIDKLLAHKRIGWTTEGTLALTDEGAARFAEAQQRAARGFDAPYYSF